MSTLDSGLETRMSRAVDARQRFLRGSSPVELLGDVLAKSWSRCQDSGLDPVRAGAGMNIDGSRLQDIIARNTLLVESATAVMHDVHHHIRHTESVIVLSDSTGVLLKSVGDPYFSEGRSRDALLPGARWSEAERGTNAVGTALLEDRQVDVLGAEHYIEDNSFLTCSAAPIHAADGSIMGAFDISGDYRTYQGHTAALVGMAAARIEQAIFRNQSQGCVLVLLQRERELLGSIHDGLIAVDVSGAITAVNDRALSWLKRDRARLVGRRWEDCFETRLQDLMSTSRVRPDGLRRLLTTSTGGVFHARVDILPGTIIQAAPMARRASAVRPAPVNGGAGLARFSGGDPTLAEAARKAAKILGRGIPLLIQGESGAGKEVFAKAYHDSDTSRRGDFVALNCAAIPESLIESELFGYQAGAFTGARKEGAPGKILQASGGTLFLDEIGDMPLPLQARLLRVLQERQVSPLGSSRVIPVDFSLVCATHRNLAASVAEGCFREDLYYRLNGLQVTLPPLRARSDILRIVDDMLRAQLGEGHQVGLAAEVSLAIRRHGWPGNLRELDHAIRLALALMEPGDTDIALAHLPETVAAALQAPRPVASEMSVEGSLEQLERQTIRQVLEQVGGNISAAAKQLGISRNTIYKKIGRR